MVLALGLAYATAIPAAACHHSCFSEHGSVTQGAQSLKTAANESNAVNLPCHHAPDEQQNRANQNQSHQNDRQPCRNMGKCYLTGELDQSPLANTEFIIQVKQDQGKASLYISVSLPATQPATAYPRQKNNSLLPPAPLYLRYENFRI